jgi:hypothetical protein
MTYRLTKQQTRANIDFTFLFLYSILAVASALPEDWADMKDNENIKVVSVPNTDKEFQDIEKNFITQVKTGSYAHRLNFNASNLKVSKVSKAEGTSGYFRLFFLVFLELLPLT